MVNGQKHLQLQRAASGSNYAPPAPTDNTWLEGLAQSRKAAAAPTATEETAVTSFIGGNGGNDTAVSSATVAIPPQLVSYVKSYQDRGVFAQFRYYTLFKRDDQAQKGPGWLALDAVLARYTEKGSETRVKVGGTRGNLWKVLNAGEGLFWSQDRKNGRLWLHGWHSVAAALGCDRFDRFFVDMPLGEALGGIKQFRAAAYAAVLSVHAKAPISKDTLTELTGLSKSSLYEYDALLKEADRLEVEQNYRLEPITTAEERQEVAWQRPGAFDFIDYLGIYFRPGQQCMAWPIPNSYKPANAGISRRRKQARHHIIDPEKYSTRGNGDKRRRLYYDERKAADKAFKRAREPNRYRAISRGKTKTAVTIWRGFGEAFF